jgi:hypothetical protein
MLFQDSGDDLSAGGGSSEICGENAGHDVKDECCIRPCILRKGHCLTEDHKCEKGHRWSCGKPIA